MRKHPERDDRSEEQGGFDFEEPAPYQANCQLMLILAAGEEAPNKGPVQRCCA